MRRAMRDPAWVFAAVALIACSGCQSGSDRRDHHRSVPTATYPQYWLTNTEIRPLAAATPLLVVGAPVLVELLPNRRVRSVGNRQPKLDGILPEEVLVRPAPGRGLMLYAREMAEIHWQSADGPILGHLHPGAFVSVVPQRGGWISIGNLPFGGADSPITAFVERERLGTTPLKPSAMAPKPNLRSVRWHKLQLTGWSFETDPLKMRAIWTSVPCVDIWMSRDARWMSQYVKGVELLGALDGIDAPWPTLQDGMDRCPAHAITRRGQELVWNGPDETETTGIVTQIPDGYRQVQAMNNDPLHAAVVNRGRVFWLIDSRNGPRCDEWQFDQAKHPDTAGKIAARLIRREQLDGLTATHAIGYSPSEGNNPARLHLGTIQFSDGTTLKCECTTDYSLLHAAGDELELMARQIPDPLVAYDPTETERWFLSMPACERARHEVVQILERDGTKATQLGFHAVVHAFEI